MIALAALTFLALYVAVVVALAKAWRWWQDRQRREMEEAQADVRAFTAYRHGLDRVAERDASRTAQRRVR